MAAITKSIELHPFGPPRRLPRPDGFKTVSISVGLSGDVIRLLANEKSADALVARVEQPGWASFPKTHTDNNTPLLFLSPGIQVHERHGWSD